MTERVSEGQAAFEDRYGSAALEVVLEIQGALMARMEENLGHVVLWEQYLRTPEAVSDALVSVIQLYIDQDSVLAGWLETAVERFETSVAGGDS